ncbi:unnamed protein product [Rhizopus stolonifer]
MSIPGDATRVREETPAANHGSRTLTVNETVEDSDSREESPESEPVGVLRLTGDMSLRQPRTIRWDEKCD